MSSPLSSLKNGKKMPLLPGRRSVPFKHQDYAEAVIDEQLGLSKSEYSWKPKKMQQKQLANENGQGPSDKELLSSMMQRLAKAEQNLRFAQEANREKDVRIKVLEDKCKIIDTARGHGNEQVLQLETKCRKLQKKIHSMEKFLEDYGMVWVGEEAESDEEKDDSKQHTDKELEPLSPLLGATQPRVWIPGSSTPTAFQLQVDFDLIVKNIEELNSLAGEGEHVISHTTKGARLKVREPVPLTLYANGIFMFDGPFRPFTDHETQLYIQDIMDGYFPSELQSRYPDGVPILLTDLRDTYFRDTRQEKFFTGTGQRLLESNLDEVSDKNIPSIREGKLKTTSQPPGRQRLTVDQYLNKIPSSIIRNGEVVDVRSGLKETLKGSVSKSPELIVIDSQLDANDSNSKSEAVDTGKAECITNLRIKSEKGDKTYSLKMKYTNTIGDLKRKINKIRKEKHSNYQLKTSFPNQTYDNDGETLEDCGLVPNATLHILLKK